MVLDFLSFRPPATAGRRSTAAATVILLTARGLSADRLEGFAVGANECVRARFVEDNPGRWLYHCHVFSHQDVGMAGWYLVE